MQTCFCFRKHQARDFRRIHQRRPPEGDTSEAGVPKKKDGVPVLTIEVFNDYLLDRDSTSESDSNHERRDVETHDLPGHTFLIQFCGASAPLNLQGRRACREIRIDRAYGYTSYG